MLINCVAYQDGRKLADIAVEDIDRFILQPGCFVWVALRDASDAELRQMQREFDLHELAVEDASHGHQRPKVEEYGDTLFVVMKLPELREGELENGEVAIFVGENFVLLGAQQQPAGLPRRARALRARARAPSAPGLGLRALRADGCGGGSLLPGARRARDRARGHRESRIFEHGEARANIERLYALKRRATVLRHRGGRRCSRWPANCTAAACRRCARSQEYFRDVHDHLARINAAIDGIRDTIGTAIQVNLSMVTIEESENHQAARRLGGDLRRVDRAGRHLGHELRAHARAEMGWGYLISSSTMPRLSRFQAMPLTKAAWYEPVRSNTLPDIQPPSAMPNSVRISTVPTRAPASAGGNARAR